MDVLWRVEHVWGDGVGVVVVVRGGGGVWWGEGWLMGEFKTLPRFHKTKTIKSNESTLVRLPKQLFSRETFYQV